MHRFGPEPKRTTDSGQKGNERTQSTFLDPIVMFWFVLVSFVTVQKTMPGCIECTDSGRNRNELPIHARNETNAPNPLFLDPIVMFWFVLVSFVTVQKTIPDCIECTDSGRNRNELPIHARNETNTPNPLFGPNSDVLVRFGQFRYCAKNHAWLH